ncbi:MAG TPA: CD225/dispanin family protein [Thermoanaerobaculia bacterium]
MSCIRCGQRVPKFGAPPELPNYLVQAIVATMCCVPFGVVAIVYSAEVGSRLRRGDVAGARDASSKAKMWSWIAFGFGVALAVLALITVLFGGFGGS